MTTSRSASLGPDESVGAALRRLREAHELTGAQLAERVEMSQPKISRIERGRGRPNPDDVGRIARALGADEDLVRQLTDRAESAHDRMTDWRPTAVGLAGRQVSLAAWEAESRVVRDFQPAVLPGLLQTSGYARFSLRAFQSLIARDSTPPADNTALATDAELTAAVSDRMHRQEALADPGKSFRFVITETVLRSRFCPAAEMVAQIDRIREIAASPNVSIRILLDDALVDVPPMHGFTLLDDRMVIVDLYNTGLITRGRNDARQYRQVFDWFEGRAEADTDPMLARYEALYIERLRAPERPDPPDPPDPPERPGPPDRG